MLNINLFRYKCAINGEIKQVHYFYELPTNPDIIFVCTNLESNKGHFIPKRQLLPSTGLLDRTRNVLYLGDIVKDSHGRTMEIIYYGYKFQFRLISVDIDATSKRNNFKMADIYSWYIKLGILDVDVVSNKFKRGQTKEVSNGG
jgi:hypothetical protein